LLFGSLGGFGVSSDSLPLALGVIQQSFEVAANSLMFRVGYGAKAIAPFLALYCAVRIAFNMWNSKPFAHLLGWGLGGLALFVSATELLVHHGISDSIALSVAQGEGEIVDVVRQWFSVKNVSNVIGFGLFAAALGNIGMKMELGESWVKPLIFGIAGAVVLFAGVAAGDALDGGGFLVAAAGKSTSLLRSVGKTGTQFLGIACTAYGMGVVAVKFSNGERWANHFVMALCGAVAAGVATWAF
jgi:hypothetical protein